MKGLYVHIPFCSSICSYCDFNKMISKKERQNLYIKRLIEEINEYKDNLNNLTSIYIGGGTPNSIDLNNLESLLISLNPFNNNLMEYSIELNPELITEDLAKLLSKYRISRVSIGVQTVNIESIKLLNRHHNKEIVLNAINILKKYNINNINIDMIFGIPNTNIEDLKEDLNFVLSLPIKHISYYSLIVEDKTILKYKIDKNEVNEIDDDTIADMYDIVSSTLNNNGFIQYEISNYAKKGYESQHNLLYWTQQNYIGLGLNAVSFIDNKRLQNSNLIKKYFKTFDKEEEYLSIKDLKCEYMMLGLRKLNGISINDYQNKFNSHPLSDFNLDKYLNKNILIIKDDRLYINKDYIFVGNSIYEEFVGD